MEKNISLEIPYNMTKYTDIVEATYIKTCRYTQEFIQKPSQGHISKESIINIVINYLDTISKKNEMIEIKYYDVNDKNRDQSNFILTFRLNLSNDIETPFSTVERVQSEFSEYGNSYELKNPLFTTFALFPARRSYILVDNDNSDQVMTKISYDEMGKTVFVNSRYDDSLNKEDHNFEFGIIVEKDIIDIGELVRKECRNHNNVEYKTECIVFD